MEQENDDLLKHLRIAKASVQNLTNRLEEEMEKNIMMALRNEDDFILPKNEVPYYQVNRKEDHNDGDVSQSEMLKKVEHIHEIIKKENHVTEDSCSLGGVEKPCSKSFENRKHWSPDFAKTEERLDILPGIVGQDQFKYDPKESLHFSDITIQYRQNAQILERIMNLTEDLEKRIIFWKELATI